MTKIVNETIFCFLQLTEFISIQYFAAQNILKEYCFFAKK